VARNDGKVMISIDKHWQTIDFFGPQAIFWADNPYYYYYCSHIPAKNISFSFCYCICCC
jgi:hypothetical protein